MALSRTQNRGSRALAAYPPALGHAKRLFLASLLAALFITLLSPGMAQAQNRTLSLYNTHTHERLTVTYKRNGRFVQAGLNQLNRFLRDWRRDEVTRIDPDLFDVVWAVYNEVGASEPIHVVSAYRSPATNNMLRSRSSGVARNSQHTQGRAMDFFIPGVAASTLRAAGLRQQQGGVGYYPRSNTPFVHLDTGSVRMWPRMTRSQLSRVFPNGRTIHVPADGRPMPGFEQAQRDLARGGSGSSASAATVVAQANSASNGDSDIVLPGEDGGGFLDALFGNNRDNPPANVPTAAAPVQVASAPAAPATTGAPVELQTASAARERYNVPSPVLPPNVSPAGGWAAPSTVAGLQVPSPTPAPTIDDIQIAALGGGQIAPAAPAPATLATPATPTSNLDNAFAIAQNAGQPAAPVAQAGQVAPVSLPPITREQQIAQTVPAPGQIAAIIEARFAEQRAAEASLNTQVAAAIQNDAALTPSPSGGPRFAPPTPLPIAPSAQPPVQLASAPANPPANSIVTAAFAAEPQPTAVATPAQSAISTLAGSAQQGSTQAAAPIPPASVPGGITSGVTGQLFPLADNIAPGIGKHSIRGAAHATLLPPEGVSLISPIVVQPSAFTPSTGFQLRSDRFGS